MGRLTLGGRGTWVWVKVEECFYCAADAAATTTDDNDHVHDDCRHPKSCICATATAPRRTTQNAAADEVSCDKFEKYTQPLLK